MATAETRLHIGADTTEIVQKAAALLILRELMQHLAFAVIVVRK
jgi:hypothetical protein